MSEIIKTSPEVLAPAGDFESFKAALMYGADAIYLAKKAFGMRAAPNNFSQEELTEAVRMAHTAGKRVYLTCNTLPHNRELSHLKAFAEEASAAKVDAFIVNDIGVMTMLQEYAPEIELHISTQAGIVNYSSANAFYKMGAKRIVLARELSLEEITEIRQNTPPDLEIEAFVHGAMCVSFSGRCLLSQYLTGRDANRGECAQPCRWSYALMEKTRPGEYFPIVEDADEGGTFILNAKDMCMIEHLDKLYKAGITSFKIEGRAKSSYYVSVVTNAYRAAVDCLMRNPDSYDPPKWILDEVNKISHREYCSGFFFGRPEHSQNYKDGGYVREYDVAAIVESCGDGYITVLQRNRFFKGAELEILCPNSEPIKITADEIIDQRGDSVEAANKASETYKIRSELMLPKCAILRMQKR